MQLRPDLTPTRDRTQGFPSVELILYSYHHHTQLAIVQPFINFFFLSWWFQWAFLKSIPLPQCSAIAQKIIESAIVNPEKATWDRVQKHSSVEIRSIILANLLTNLTNLLFFIIITRSKETVHSGFEPRQRSRNFSLSIFVIFFLIRYVSYVQRLIIPKARVLHKVNLMTLKGKSYLFFFHL